MFDETLLDSVLSTERGLRRKRRWVSWVTATAVEGLALGLLVLTPLVNIPALPKTFFSELLFVPAPPPAPAATVLVSRPARRHVTQKELLTAPLVIPDKIAKFVEPPENSEIGVAAIGVPGGLSNGVPGGFTGSAFLGLTSIGLPPRPPEGHQPKRIQVGGQVEAAKLLYQPKPEYPALARFARIQGVVRLEAIIGVNGTIEDLKVASGHPLLAKAALEAVRQWRYQPTLLNGQPVEVETEIEVNFKLGE